MTGGTSEHAFLGPRGNNAPRTRSLVFSLSCEEVRGVVTGGAKKEEGFFFPDGPTSRRGQEGRQAGMLTLGNW